MFNTIIVEIIRTNSHAADCIEILCIKLWCVTNRFPEPIYAICELQFPISCPLNRPYIPHAFTHTPTHVFNKPTKKNTQPRIIVLALSTTEHYQTRQKPIDENYKHS